MIKGSLIITKQIELHESRIFIRRYLLNNSLFLERKIVLLLVLILLDVILLSLLNKKNLIRESLMKEKNS